MNAKTTLAVLRLLMLCSPFLIGGCLSSKLSDLSSALNQVASRHPDPQLVGDALPAYLLLMDAMVVDNPDDPDLLLGAAELYTTYAGLLPGSETGDEAPEGLPRAAIAASRALDYAMRAWRLQLADAPDPRASSFAELEHTVESMPSKNLPLLYALGMSWASWCRYNADDILAAAELPRAELFLKRVAAIEPSYREGTAVLLLGAMAATLPPEMGGDLERSKDYFEQALSLENPSPMTRLLYARTYAVAAGDRALFERLLDEILPDEAAMTSPTLVTTQAEALLQQADELFGRN